MNKQPLLSICIATYNRADYIGETLDSIIPQLDDDVEVVIADGASTDNTEAVMKKYIDPRIRYIRLPVKGGVDQDYCKAVELARGEFCWLFTDDDILRPGAIAAAKKAIREGYGLIIINAEVRDKKVEAILEHRRTVTNQNKTYAPNEMEQLFVDTLNYISFIGAIVIRRSIWLSREQKPYFGTEFVHIGVIFQKPLPEPALLIAEPFIIIRFGNAQWTSRSFHVWMFKWPKLVWSFDHITHDAKKKICMREPWRSIKVLFIQRCFGAYNKASYNQFLSTVDANMLWRFCAWLIAICPQKITFGLYYLYSRVRGPECRKAYDFCKKESESWS